MARVTNSMSISSCAFSSFKASLSASYSHKLSLFLLRVLIKFEFTFSVNSLVRYIMKSNPFESIFFKASFSSELGDYFSFLRTHIMSLEFWHAILARHCNIVIPDEDYILKFIFFGRRI